jgi:hypothetical protein
VSNPIAFPNSTTTYTLTATNTASGCIATDQLLVTVNNNLPLANAGPDFAINCAQNQSGLSIGMPSIPGVIYSWNPSTGLSSATVSNPIANPNATTTYTVIATNPTNGCIAIDQVVVAVSIDVPTANAGPDVNITCVQNPTGSSIGVASVTGVTYSWSPSAGLSSATVSNPIAFPNSTTTYTLTATNTASGCIATDQLLVTVNNNLPLANAGPDQSICNGGITTLIASGTANYFWNNNVSNGVSFSPLLSATYTLTAIDNVSGCISNDQVVVNVNALPTVNAGIDQTVCIGTSVTLSGTGATTYSWNNSVSNGVSFNPNSTSTYSVSGTDVNGCSNTDQVTVTVNSLPNVNAGPDQALCQGESTSLFGTGANTYSWSNNVVNGVGFLPTTTQAYTVTGTNTTTGCTNADTVTVTVNPLPTVNAGTDQTICKGDAVTLTGAGASTYAWDNNVSNGLAFNPIATASYSVSGTDVNGCTNSDQVTVTVNEATASALTESAIDSYTLNGQTYTQSGTYTQVIPNAAGCDSTITLNLTLSFTGIPEIGKTNIMVYPNPTNDLLNIILPTESAVNYVLLDSRGRKVLEGSFFGTENQISLKACMPGAYFLKIGQKEVPIRVIKQ